MTEIITAVAISRGKALTFFGLATAALGVSSVEPHPMLRRKRRVWSAVRKDAEAGRTGVRRGALAAQRGVKKGVSDYVLAETYERENRFGTARAALTPQLSAFRRTMGAERNSEQLCFLATRDGRTAVTRPFRCRA